MRHTFRHLAMVAIAALTISACSSGSSNKPTSPASDQNPSGGTTQTESVSPSGSASPSEAASPSSPASSGGGDSTGTWPRTVEHALGKADIPAQPKRVVLTSISLTGTALAIGAPVIASAAAPKSSLTDDQGFFTQWAAVAHERGVQVLYPDLKLNIDAVEAAKPDLIIGSIIGGDSTKDAYEQLNQIAPTVMLDYGKKSWDELAVTIGKATGLEDKAKAVLAEFDDYVAKKAKEIKLPTQPTSLITYNGAEGIMMFNPESPQARIFTGLGFTWAPVNAELAASKRSDATAFTAENAPVALADVQSLFVIPFGKDVLTPMKADPLLANLSALKSGQIDQLPDSSFRIDYYSGKLLVDHLVSKFSA